VANEEGSNVTRDPSFFGHIASTDYEFNTHLISEREAVVLFLKLDDHLKDMLRHVDKAETKQDFYVIGTFFLIAHRELRNSFVQILRRLGYNAMFLLRVVLESMKFALLIHEDETLARVWIEKDEHPEEFKKRLRFAAFPEAMPYRERAEEIRKIVGDFWAHPNIGYLSTTAKMTATEIQVHSLDPEEAVFCGYILTLFEVYMITIAVLGMIFETKFPVYDTSMKQKYKELWMSYQKLENSYKRRAEGKEKRWKGEPF
jgi:hypothetical protein